MEEKKKLTREMIIELVGAKIENEYGLEQLGHFERSVTTRMVGEIVDLLERLGYSLQE